jgi:hypothetical protein
VTGRKVASLSSSLLARKGAARSADATVDAPQPPAAKTPYDPAAARPSPEPPSPAAPLPHAVEAAPEPPAAAASEPATRPAIAPEIRAYA